MLTVNNDGDLSLIAKSTIAGDYAPGMIQAVGDMQTINIGQPLLAYSKGTDPARIWNFTRTLPTFSTEADSNFLVVDDICNALVISVHYTYNGTDTATEFASSSEHNRLRLWAYLYDDGQQKYYPECLVGEQSLYAKHTTAIFTTVGVNRNIPNVEEVLFPTCGFQHFFLDYGGLVYDDATFAAALLAVNIYVQPVVLSYKIPDIF